MARPLKVERKCDCCKCVMFNRQSHAKYCKKCSEDIRKKKYKKNRKIKVLNSQIINITEKCGFPKNAKKK